MERALRLCARGALVLSILAGSGALQSSFGQTTVAGSSMALNSYTLGPGSPLMTGPGYLATYLDVGDSGDGGSMINLSFDASRGVGVGDPHMNIVVADSKFGFNISNPALTNYSSGNLWLPAGKYVVRTERDSPNNPTAMTTTSTLSAVNVSAVTGSAAFDNNHTNANALAAADTYIENFRKGQANIRIRGVAPGTNVQVTQTSEAFDWGSNIHGTSTAIFSNTQYTNFFLDHFNMMVPSRMGKWNNQESTRDSVNMGGLDAYYDFAEANGLKIRAHNLIWGNNTSSHEVPSWAVNMLNNPASTDTFNAGTNPQGTNLQNQTALWHPTTVAPGGTPNAGEPSEISERIAYYVGDGPGGLADQSTRYQQIDVYNESWHTGVNTVGSNNYWDRYGAAGISDIHEAVKAAVAASGGNAKVYVNEYNSLNVTGGSEDNYANWYRSHIETIENADGNAADQTIEGIGIQYWATDTHTATRVQQALQNLNVTGLPITLTESGVQGTGPDGLPNNSAFSIQIVTETMRMIFGNPNATSHLIWGVWEGARDPNLQGGFSLVDAGWNLTAGGVAYEALREQFKTADFNAVVNPDGTISFPDGGFFGGYKVTINGQDYTLQLVKGTTEYELFADTNLGDLDDDGIVDDKDIDILWHVVRGMDPDDPNQDDTEDLNNDGLVNEDDVDYMLRNLLDIGPDRAYGDADLDGGVGGLDFTAWRLRAGTGWAHGDFDGDGGIGGLDFTLWRTRPTTYPDQVGQHGSVSPVPEPSALVLGIMGALAFGLAMRRRTAAGI